MVSWDYYNKFDEINDRYLPRFGEGETKATQIVTAVNKLVYKWYNDGDVYDNTCHLQGWANDISSFANWLHQNTEIPFILEDVWKCRSEDDYEYVLREIADNLFNDEYLERMDQEPKVGSVYNSSGPFKVIERDHEKED